VRCSAKASFNGFGFRTRTDPGSRPFITEVFESGPAREAGLRRGDEIGRGGLGSGFVAVADLLADGSTLSDAFGPAEVGGNAAACGSSATARTRARSA